MNPYNQPPGSNYGPLTHYQLAPYRKPLRKWSTIICLGMFLVNVVSIVVMLLLNSGFSIPIFFDVSLPVSDLIDETIQLVAYVSGFWLPTLMMVLWIRIPSSTAFPMRRPDAKWLIPAVFICLGTSVVGSLASGMLSSVIQALFHVTPTMPDMPSPVGVGANIVYVISMTVAPAIFEELMFRGVILQSLRRYGDGFALVVSSILFGVIHGNLIQGPNAILMGLVMGYFVLRTGSLVTGIVIHFVNNGMSVVLGYLFDLLGEQQADNIYLAVLGGYLILGAASLAYLFSRHGNLFRVAPSNSPLPTRQKYTAFFTTAAAIIYLLLSVWLTSFYFEPLRVIA